MALPTASDNAFPSVLVTEGTAPSSPASGKQRVYIDSTSHKLTRKNSSGTVTVIEGISDTGTIATYVDLTDQGSDPSSPSAGNHRFYAKAGGLYVKDSSATVVGALGAGGGGGGTITTASATLSGSDIAINTSTYTDILSFSLAAGTWIVMSSLLCSSDSGTIGITCKIWDGTNLFASGDSVLQGGAIRQQQAIITPPIVLGSTTTVKISGIAIVGAGHILVSTVSAVVAKASNFVAFQVA